MIKNLTSGSHWSVTHNRNVFFSTARENRRGSGELTGEVSRRLGGRGGEGEGAGRLGEAVRSSSVHSSLMGSSGGPSASSPAAGACGR